MEIVFRAVLAALIFACWTGGARAQPSATPDVITLPSPNAGDDGSLPPPPCGTQPITIASLPWPSAALLAEIHAKLLRDEFGCTSQVLPGQMLATISAMANGGQPAVVPEVWIGRIASVWNEAISDQKLRQIGLSYADNNFEGWFIPDYLSSAHPDLKTVADLKDNWQLFANGGKKGQLVSCPSDWGCAVINRNILRANGLDQLFDIVTPANRYQLDQLIAEAVSGKKPILFYYWEPNAVLSQFKFTRLDLGPFNKENFTCLGERDCADPKPSRFAPDPVVIALAQWVFTGAPDVAAYFQRAAMPVSEMNALLAELNKPGETVDKVADDFISNREAVWLPWIGADAP